MRLDELRYIEVDGELIEVHGCLDCPCYNEKEDDYLPANSCKHPLRSKVSASSLEYLGGGICYERHGTYFKGVVECPLREVKE